MNAPNECCSSCGPWWRLPLLLALVLAVAWILRGRGIRETTPGTPARPAIQADPSSKIVSMTIDYGEGRRTRFEPVAWHKGMTIYELMRATPSDDLGLKVRGTGESAFLTNLDGIENEGAGGRNWTYSVDGKAGDRSFAVYELEPGDQVLWTFGKQQ